MTALYRVSGSSRNATLSDAEIFSLTQENSWCEIPNLSSHSQSVEQSVKQVSDALCTVYGHENQHKSILTKILNREKSQVFVSNEHYHKAFNNFYS